jgi:hypothetical protein
MASFRLLQRQDGASLKEEIGLTATLFAGPHASCGSAFVVPTLSVEKSSFAYYLNDDLY